jgi:hypothetical protein
VETGLRGVADLRLEAHDGARVRFGDRQGRVHEVLVEEHEGPAVPASCGAPPEPQRIFRASVSTP